MNIEDHIHLDPELTIDDVSDAIFEAIADGLLLKEDFKTFLRISYKELGTPKKLRILSKAISELLKKGYKDKLRPEETPAILVREGNKQYLVAYDFNRVSISEPIDCDCPDNSLIIMHESEADAKIAAWERKEEFIDINRKREANE